MSNLLGNLVNLFSSDSTPVLPVNTRSVQLQDGSTFEQILNEAGKLVSNSDLTTALMPQSGEAVDPHGAQDPAEGMTTTTRLVTETKVTQESFRLSIHAESLEAGMHQVTRLLGDLARLPDEQGAALVTSLASGKIASSEALGFVQTLKSVVAGWNADELKSVKDGALQAQWLSRIQQDPQAALALAQAFMNPPQVTTTSHLVGETVLSDNLATQNQNPWANFEIDGFSFARAELDIRTSTTMTTTLSGVKSSLVGMGEEVQLPNDWKVVTTPNVYASVESAPKNLQALIDLLSQSNAGKVLLTQAVAYEFSLRVSTQEGSWTGATSAPIRFDDMTPATKTVLSSVEELQAKVSSPSLTDKSVIQVTTTPAVESKVPTRIVAPQEIPGQPQVMPPVLAVSALKPEVAPSEPVQTIILKMETPVLKEVVGKVSEPVVQLPRMTPLVAENIEITSTVMSQQNLVSAAPTQPPTSSSASLIEGKWIDGASISEATSISEKPLTAKGVQNVIVSETSLEAQVEMLPKMADQKMNLISDPSERSMKMDASTPTNSSVQMTPSSFLPVVVEEPLVSVTPPVPNEDGDMNVSKIGASTVTGDVPPKEMTPKTGTPLVITSDNGLKEMIASTVPLAKDNSAKPSWMDVKTVDLKLNVQETPENPKGNWTITTSTKTDVPTVVNAPRLDSAGVRAENIIQQITQQVSIEGVRTHSISRLSFQLVPENLGKVTIQVALVDQVVTAKLMVSHGEVREILQNHLVELKTSLYQAGLQIDQLQVQVQGGGAGLLSQYYQFQQDGYGNYSGMSEKAQVKRENENLSLEAAGVPGNWNVVNLLV
jgi:flagellar hook-length control protein FliK